MTDKTCGTCAYWESRSWTPNNGHCHRYPPTRPSTATPVHPTPQFPYTEIDAWCGEWLEKDV